MPQGSAHGIRALPSSTLETPIRPALARAALGLTAWASSSLFGLYILVFYALAVVTGDLARWNRVLPLHDPADPVGNVGMGLHFVGGGLLLVLGSVQFLGGLRAWAPSVHRALGRLYVLGAAAASVGGLGFIATRGTLGGPVMDLGFGLYGALMGAAAVGVVRYGVARDTARHRAWAVRLYALVLGSWLYRMEYGFWLLFTDGLGTAPGFRGPFDRFMSFAFYLPNLAVAELWLRADGREPRGATLAFLVATAFVLLGSYFFARHYWVPGILMGLAR